MVAHRPWAWSLAASCSQRSMVPPETTARPSLCTCSISECAFAWLYPNSLRNTYVTYVIRLTGSFQTTTTQRGESRGSSPIRSTRTGSGARVTDVPAIGGIVPQRRRTRESAASGDARLEPELRDGLLDLRGEARRVEPDQPTQVADGAMVDEPVRRDPEDPHADVAERRVRAPRPL